MRYRYDQLISRCARRRSIFAKKLVRLFIIVGDIYEEIWLANLETFMGRKCSQYNARHLRAEETINVYRNVFDSQQIEKDSVNIFEVFV